MGMNVSGKKAERWETSMSPLWLMLFLYSHHIYGRHTDAL